MTLKTSDSDKGRFAYDGLDRVIHEKARLGVLTSLIGHPGGVLFSDLKSLCGLTDGNLSRHLQVLEEAGVVAIAKAFVDNRPQTRCKITAAGRKRYMDYLDVLEQVVRDAADAAKSAAKAAGKAAKDGELPPGRLAPA